MPNRTEKISKLLQRELGEIFQVAGKDMYHGVIITVTSVRISADLSFAKVFLSIFPGQHNREIMESIEINKKYFRHQLAQRIKSQIKAIPEIAFYVDDSLDYIDTIDQLLKP